MTRVQARERFDQLTSGTYWREREEMDGRITNRTQITREEWLHLVFRPGTQALLSGLAEMAELRSILDAR